MTNQKRPQRNATTGKKKQSAPFLMQAFVFALILFIAHYISSFISPYFLLPTPVAGMILLYVLLTCHIVKLEWVDDFAAAMISVIGFLFVPSGISMIADLKILQQEGVQLILVILVSTIILLVVTAYTTQLLEWFTGLFHHSQPTPDEADHHAPSHK